MSVLIPNPFSSYSMNEEELLEGATLTIGQEQFIQNQISMAAQERLSLDYDPDAPLKFLQREAELKGSIGAYQYLLDCSENAKSVKHGLPPQ